MSTIVTRAGKGSPLTHNEVDANFNNLNNDKVEESTTITAGTGLSGGGDLSANRTISLANTAVTPGSYGSASAVGTFTVDAQGRLTAASNTNIQTPNSVTFNNAGAGGASGSTFNGSGALTVSYNTVGAPSTGGANATGTWGISISGNAATATTASNVNNGTLTMNVSGTGLSGSQTFTANQSGNATFTVTSNATNANTGSTIVARDASGNFSAGTITATLNGNASTASSAAALTATTWQRIVGNAINYGSYGSIGVTGTTNTYAGISFSDVSGTLMMNSGASGFYYNNSTWRVYWDSSGNQVNTGNVTAYASDKRLKKNIQAIENPFSILESINGVYFDWDTEECAKWDFHPPAQDAGVIAQDVQKVFPYAVHPAPFDRDPLCETGSKSGKDYLTVQYEKLVPVLIEAIKELKAEVEALKAAK